MKLSNHMLGFYIQIILTTVLSSPVEYATQNVRNYKRQCGFDDQVLNTKSENRFKRFVIYGNVWENKIVTWNFPNRVHPKSQDDLYFIKSSIRDSFRMWEEQINDIEFHETDDLNADIMISFERMEHGDNSRFGGPGGTIAHAYPPSSGIGGDVHFDEDEDWNFKGVDDNTESSDFFSIALHEIGHALGLGHSDIKKAVMYESSSKKRYELHEDDIRGIQSLYGAREFSQRNPVRRTSTQIISSSQTTQQIIKPTVSYQSPQLPDHRLISTKPNTCGIQLNDNSLIRKLFIKLLNKICHKN